MKLTCDEATAICDKNQYGEASFWEKVKLNFHVFLCAKCGMYSRQNNIMTKCYDTHSEVEKNKEHCLEEDEKEIMEENVRTNL